MAIIDEIIQRLWPRLAVSFCLEIEMTRDELLTKLAMELEEWPKTLEGTKDSILASPWRWFWLGAAQSVCVGKQGDAINDIGGNHWLNRRTELINCPPDSEAPEWATYKAQDKDGQWHWYEIKPSGHDSNLWMMEGDGVCEPASEGSTPAGHDWRGTLTEVNQSTCTAEEDAAWAEKDAQLNGAKHWDGKGTPPVGAWVRIRTAGGDKGCADVVAHHNGGFVVWQHSDMNYRRWHADFLRPVKTERERWVERAIAALKPTMGRFAIEQKDIFGMIYDAGLARIAEDE